MVEDQKKKKIEMENKLKRMKQNLNTIKDQSEVEQDFKKTNKSKANKKVSSVKKEKIQEINNQNVRDYQNEQINDYPSQWEKKRNRKKFFKKYIPFLIIVLIITMLAIFITIVQIDSEFLPKKKNEVEDISKSDDEIEETQVVEVEKKRAEDAKYGIKSFTETYNENDLNIVYYADVDGRTNTFKNYSDVPNGSKKIEYIQIDGLKDKNIQGKINEKLKSEAYNLENKEKRNQLITPYVYANFSNVLSVQYSRTDNNSDDFDVKCLNINLATGDDIKINDVFVSSAPVNSYIAEGVYKSLAWSDKAKTGSRRRRF